MKFKDIFKRLMSFFKPYWGLMILSLIFALIYVALNLSIPILTGQAVDLIIGKNNVDFANIAKIIGVAAVFIILASLFQWLMLQCTNKISYNAVCDIRRAAFYKLNRIPIKYSDTRSHGDILSMIITDSELISDGLLQTFSQLFVGIVTIITTIIIMVTINHTIGLIVILLTPLSVFVASFINKRIHTKFYEQSQIRGEMTSLVNDLVGNQKVVKAFSYEGTAQERFEEINERLNKVGVMAQFVSALTNPSTRFVNSLINAVVGVTGAFFVLNNWLSIGQLSMFLQYANQYTKPFNEISSVITELQNAFAGAKRIFEFLDQPEESYDDDLPQLDCCNGNISISDVSFSYSPKVPLIEHFNLDVHSGQRIAIVGPTGCGKTTFINLLMRFYDVTGGAIYLDSYNIQEINRQSLRSQYGMVLQETWVFSGTVRDNIAFGKPDATIDEVIAAAKAAHADSFIRRLPNGYDTVISDSGHGISQGQRQLLSIARVMLLDPPMLILDEATSSIDTRTEQRIQSAFTAMMKGKTSFIVAHRLSTIMESDVILVMNKGKIIEQGTHYELMEKQGFYYNLYNSQYKI